MPGLKNKRAVKSCAIMTDLVSPTTEAKTPFLQSQSAETLSKKPAPKMHGRSVSEIPAGSNQRSKLTPQRMAAIKRRLGRSDKAIHLVPTGKSADGRPIFSISAPSKPAPVARAAITAADLGDDKSGDLSSSDTMVNPVSLTDAPLTKTQCNESSPLVDGTAGDSSGYESLDVTTSDDPPSLTDQHGEQEKTKTFWQKYGCCFKG
jgi:hypothetical protein